MILEMLIAGSIGNTVVGAWKSINMDDKALEKYAKAYEKSEEAKLLIKNKSEKTDKRIKNVVRKKVAIKEYTIPRFAEVYKIIRDLDIESRENENRLQNVDVLDKFTKLDKLTDSIKLPLTDREYICGTVFRGLGGMMVKDSERYLSAANQQSSFANVQYSQAENIVDVLDAIEKRADRIAKVLSGFNFMLSNILNEAEKIIFAKGKNFNLYSDEDIKILLTCENIATGLSDIFDVPIIDEQGNLSTIAQDMILKAELFLNKIEELRY